MIRQLRSPAGVAIITVLAVIVVAAAANVEALLPPPSTFAPAATATAASQAASPAVAISTLLPMIHPSVPSTCPVTHLERPVQSPPISERALPPIRPFARGGQFLFGNEHLWIFLPADGVLQLRPGDQEVKFGWWRLRGGDLSISGRRLDGDAPPLGSIIPAGYEGGGFQATGLTFPTPGCWEVTGSASGTLTFVVYVRSPADAELGTPPPGNVPCRTADDVTAVLDRFMSAFNTGNAGFIAAATSPYAQWFSLTLPEGHEVAYGRDPMAQHLAQRHAAGDRLSAPQIAITSLVGWDGSAHFAVTSLRLERSGEAHELQGQGALQCGGPAEGVVVLSLGT